MDSKINLYGASGHAKVIIDILNESEIVIKAVIDDNPKNDKILGMPLQKNKGTKLKCQSNSPMINNLSGCIMATWLTKCLLLSCLPAYQTFV